MKVLTHKIKNNKIQCIHCQDIIESVLRCGWVACSCNKVAVEGGSCYLRRSSSSREDWVELSEYRYEDENDNCD